MERKDPSKQKRTLIDEEVQRQKDEERGTNLQEVGTGHGLVDSKDQEIEGEGAEGEDQE